MVEAVVHLEAGEEVGGHLAAGAALVAAGVRLAVAVAAAGVLEAGVEAAAWAAVLRL